LRAVAHGHLCLGISQRRCSCQWEVQARLLRPGLLVTSGKRRLRGVDTVRGIAAGFGILAGARAMRRVHRLH